LEPGDPEYLPRPQSEQSFSASIPAEAEYLPVFKMNLLLVVIRLAGGVL